MRLWPVTTTKTEMIPQMLAKNTHMKLGLKGDMRLRAVITIKTVECLHKNIKLTETNEIGPKIEGR